MSPQQVAYRSNPITTEDPISAATGLPLSLSSNSPSPLSTPALSPSLPDVPLSSTTSTTSFYPYPPPTIRPVSNSKQSTVRQEGLRRLKSTRLDPTKFVYLRLRLQIKWHLQEICRRKRIADRSISQMRTNLSSPPLPVPLTLPPLTPAPSPTAPLPAFRRTGIPRAAVPASVRLKAAKRDLRFKIAQSNSYRTNYLRLRSKAKWRSKGLDLGKRPIPPPPPPPGSRQLDSTGPDDLGSGEDRINARFTLTGERFQHSSCAYSPNTSTK